MPSFYCMAFIVKPVMRYEMRAGCEVTLRGISRQQKCVPETKRSIHDVLY